MLNRIVDGRTDLVFDYLSAGHPATATDDAGVSLLEWCAYYGDVSAIKFLLSQGAALEALGVNLDLNGACFHGHWRLCQFLLESGADANHPLSDTGETPLHAALTKANRPAARHVVRVLLAHGANPDRRTHDGAATGAFMRAARTRGETPLHRAAAFSDEKTIALLLDAGAARGATDAHGDTPLAWASWHLRPGSILKLLGHGEHALSDAHVERMRSDHGFGAHDGLELALLGEPHC